MNLLSLRRQRTNRHHKPLNEIKIDADAIFQNFQLIQSLQPGNHIFPVLKSNAYGHGTQQIASILKSIHTPLICVDSYPEAQIVRKYSSKEVLMMGETIASNYTHFNHRWLHVAIWSHQLLDTLIQTGNPRKIHLFLNTGMHREGVQLSQLGSLLQKLKGTNMKVIGVMSHFANADEDDASFDAYQIDVFKQGVTMIREAGFEPDHIHQNNTAGIAQHADSIFTASRTGLGLYGYSPFNESNTVQQSVYQELRPALSVFSTVTAIQFVKKGESVSYGHRWTASQDTRLAILPFGYHEGLRRSLRDKRSVRRNDQWFPVVGTICMNLCCVDIGDAEITLGDQIEIISSDTDAPNSIMHYARIDGTIPYEVLVNLDEKVRRVVV